MSEELIPIYIMGKQYMVPPTLTIMKAMEYAGYQLIRGVGCRGGFCGACATVYRLPGDYRLQIGLACQTVVQPGMYLAQIPFFPAQRAAYRLHELQPTFQTLFTLYPELMRCLSCGTCTKACPQDIDVKQYMADAMRGDIHAVADRSFDCIMCGLCAARCPAEEAQYNIAILCRRLYGKYLAPKAKHLLERVKEVEEGKWDAAVEELKGLSEEELRKRYNARDIEPE
ncbi:MAG: 4Fe-4S dicluster domain-containing protein [Anaerolineae bacterium]|jgi:ferredoxin|nr:4Fe-4S dicluster domain-containing protein [Anaerolineae bacterium]MDH7472721.1 4Fe-4S dicluster domain-containing protein [Anaerolineae bacterium]